MTKNNINTYQADSIKVLKGLFTTKGILDFIKKFKNAINNLS